MKTEKDGKLFYKYQPANYNLFENLKNKQLYFRDPRSYNDPLDSKVKGYLKATRKKWKDYINKIHPPPRPEFKQLADITIDIYLMDGTLSKEENLLVQENPNDRIDYCPLTCCLSEESDNILMWSHYANGHKGVCLSFKSKYKPKPKLRRKPEYQLTVNSEFSPVFPIEYKLDRPEPINLVDDFLANYSHLSDSLLFDFLLTKSPCWSYEKEYRMFLTEPEIQNKVSFEKEELEGIIFGLRVNYGDARTITKIIEKHYYDIPIKFYKTQISENKYTLEKIEIDNDEIDEYLENLPL